MHGEDSSNFRILDKADQTLVMKLADLMVEAFPTKTHDQKRSRPWTNHLLDMQSPYSMEQQKRMNDHLFKEFFDARSGPNDDLIYQTAMRIARELRGGGEAAKFSSAEYKEIQTRADELFRERQRAYDDLDAPSGQANRGGRLSPPEQIRCKWRLTT